MYLLDTLLAMKQSTSYTVMVYLYLSNMQDYTAVNEVYAKSFTSHYPARLVVAINCIHFDSTTFNKINFYYYDPHKAIRTLFLCV